MELRRRGTWALGVALAAFCWAPPVAADDSRYQNIIVGARATGTGGAFAAISDDASGLVYNPAGIVDVKRANLSVSTSLYGFERHSGGGIFTGLPLTGLPKLSSTDINIIPSSAGTVMGLGELLPDGAHRHAIGFGLMVPSLTSVSEQEDTTSNWRTSTGIRRSRRINDRTLYAGVGYAYRLSEVARLGLALHYVLRSVDAVDEYLFVSPAERAGEARVVSGQSDLKLQSGSLVAVGGVKLVPYRKLSLGLSFTTQSVQLHHNGSFTLRESRPGQDPGTTEYSALAVEINEGPRANLGPLGSRSPFSVRAGLAWVERADWTFMADVIGYLPVYYELIPRTAADGTPIEESRVPLATRVERGPVVNGATGFEKLLGRDLSLSVGAFTNLPSSPMLKVEPGTNTLVQGTSRLSRIPMVGTTFALGYFSEHSLSRLGFMTAFGVGDRVGVKDRDALATGNGRVQFERFAASEWTFYVFISSTFRYGEGRSERTLFGLPSFRGGKS
ncbi:MAG: hypothetical protein AB2A00_36990 [Myxococcota bacterium]